MAEPEFRIGLGYSPRKTFKRWVKKYMRSRPQKHMLLANAFTLYDRIHR